MERIVNTIRHTPRSYVRKIHGSEFQAGMPDLVGCRAGRFFGIEVKRIGEKPSALQVEELQRIRAAGGLACWCDSFDGFLEFWRTVQ